MRRRQFIAGLLSAASSGANAQQQVKRPIVGFLGASTPTAWGQWVAAFARRLRELGWIDGHTVTIEYRWTEGRSERTAEFATEFIRLKAEVIVTSGTPNVLVLRQATSSIPIVFALAADPLGDGLVSSLARPGGNVTGLSIQSTDLIGKRLEILREIVPGLRTLAILANVANPAALGQIAEVEGLARNLGVGIITLAVRRAEDIAPAFNSLGGRAEALYNPPDLLTDANQVMINTLSLTARLPIMHGYQENVEAGGLVSYGPSYAELFRRAADYVDKILRGAKPADLPVEQPTKFDLIINLTTARAIGVTVSPTVLARAVKVIE